LPFSFSKERGWGEFKPQRGKIQWHRAKPCENKYTPFQALKGRHP